MYITKLRKSLHSIQAQVNVDIKIAKGNPVAHGDCNVEEPIDGPAVVEVDHAYQLMSVVDDHIGHAQIVVAHD